MARDLKKEVKYVIEWLASEFKYLKRLHNVLEKIQSENVSRQEKDLKTAFKVARYVGKSERRADKPLKNILSVLNKIKDTDLHRELKQMDIAGQKLVREGSLYLGSLRKGLKNTQTTISIRENYPSRSLEQKTQTQVSKLEVEVEDMEKWVSALQVGLKQVSKWQEKHTNELPRRNFLKKLAYGLGIAALNPAKALAKLPLTDSEINEIKNFFIM